MDGLRQRLHAAETAVREMKEAALKAALRRQQNATSRAETALAKQRLSSPPSFDTPPIGGRGAGSAPRAPSAAPRAAVVDAPLVVVGNDAEGVSDDPRLDETTTPDKGSVRLDDVVRVIASTGLCRSKDVRRELARLWNLRNDGATRRHLARARTRRREFDQCNFRERGEPVCGCDRGRRGESGWRSASRNARAVRGADDSANRSARHDHVCDGWRAGVGRGGEVIAEQIIAV